MKRPPRNGEPALVHKTQNTGDEQTLAICDENFDPQIVKRMRDMLEKPLAGYRLELTTRRPGFFVIRDSDNSLISENWIYRDGENINLTTTLIGQLWHADEALMLADLEQCAALMLVESQANGH